MYCISPVNGYPRLPSMVSLCDASYNPFSAKYLIFFFLRAFALVASTLSRCLSRDVPDACRFLIQSGSPAAYTQVHTEAICGDKDDFCAADVPFAVCSFRSVAYRLRLFSRHLFAVHSAICISFMACGRVFYHCQGFKGFLIISNLRRLPSLHLFPSGVFLSSVLAFVG